MKTVLAALNAQYIHTCPRGAQSPGERPAGGFCRHAL